MAKGSADAHRRDPVRTVSESRMTMRAYPHYRDSGVEWIGDVPSHWKMRRLKDVGRLVAGAGFPVALQGVEGEELPFFKVADLESASKGKWMIRGDHSVSRETATDIRARVIPAGSVVYAKIGAALLLNRRRVTTVPCCIDNNMSAFVPFPDVVTTEWALSTLSLVDFRRYVNPGAVPSLSEGDQSVLPVPLPPVDEQCAITALLDGETERIDGLVKKKRLLIERLEEYRTALITRTVTRGLPPEAARAAGLDPVPRLRPSGVEWLGDVPERWAVLRLRDCGHVQTGPFGSQLHADEYITGGVPVINPSNLVDGRLSPDQDGTITPSKASELARHALLAGDIAFGRRGEMARAALVATTDLPALCGTGCLRIRPDFRCADSSFLLYSLGLMDCEVGLRPSPSGRHLQT